MQLAYDRYLDQILGGWIGKSMGGAVGARFEGNKGWIQIRPEEMFPAAMPPNDDLDLQVLWLKVLEEKGAALTSDDLAAAWLENCWYPFNEYGIFRRNWRLGIHPPYTGSFTNQFWETGEGCPIRAEIWGYVFPGAPDLAAKYAGMDGVLDHTGQSVGAEKMLAAMASMAFFVPDVRRLASMFLHYLPPGTPIARLTQAAFQCYDEGLSLREARDRLMALDGNPEACDAQINIPFTFLGLLYGGSDLEKVMLSALACGYDTDCTLASAAALVGQILGASRIPAYLKEQVGDALVMGIQYHRPEMTLSALARDTAQVGLHLAGQSATGITLTGAPKHLSARVPFERQYASRVWIEYLGASRGIPCTAPGEPLQVVLHMEGEHRETAIDITAPEGWQVIPAQFSLPAHLSSMPLTIHPPAQPQSWSMRNLFAVRAETETPIQYTFGVAGAGLWQFLGIYYDAVPDETEPTQQRRRFNQHFVSLAHNYLPEPDLNTTEIHSDWSRKLGRPALVPSYEHEIDLSRLIGLRGPYCAYLARTLYSPTEREVYLVIGNNDAFRLYLNGDCLAEADEVVWWAPFNNVYRVKLKKGENHILLKLLKRGDTLKFSLGIREATGHPGGFNCEDWVVDLVDIPNG